MSDTWATITPDKGIEKEEVEFEIEGQEEKQEQLPLDLEVEQPEAKEVKAVEKEEEEEKPEEESALEGVETSGAQKRIRQLVQQKKEREAEIEKLLQQNKEMQLTLQAQQDQYKNALESNISNSEMQLKERLVIAKDSYRRALDSGDTDAIVQAQEYLNSTQVETARLEEYKKNYAAMSPAQKEQVASEVATQQEQQGDTYNGYNLKAYQWAASNEWFNQDQILTNAALIIDNQLKEEGYDPNDDEFYQEVDKRLAENFPHKFGKTVAQETEVPRTKAASSPSQVVAGASLAPKTSSGKKVKLTQEDVRLAQKWGISLEQYAAEKLKIENSEDGSYTTIN